MAALSLTPGEKDIRRIVMAVRQVIQGRSDATGIVNLTVSSITTTVLAPACGPVSQVFLYPQSLASAGFLTSVSASNTSAGQFVINHSVTSNANLTYSWVALG